MARKRSQKAVIRTDKPVKGFTVPTSFNGCHEVQMNEKRDRDISDNWRDVLVAYAPHWQGIFYGLAMLIFVLIAAFVLPDTVLAAFVLKRLKSLF
jgi:hypothetical protein